MYHSCHVKSKTGAKLIEPKGDNCIHELSGRPHVKQTVFAELQYIKMRESDSYEVKVTWGYDDFFVTA